MIQTLNNSPTIKATQTGIVLLLPDGTIQACDGIAAALFGSSIEQLIGTTFFDLLWQSIHFDGAAFDPNDHPVKITFRTGQPCQNITVSVYKPTGELIWLRLDATPLFQAAHQPPYAALTSICEVSAPPNEASDLLRCLDVSGEGSDLDALEAQRKAEEILQHTAELNAFRISLTDALRPLADPIEIQATASRVLGESLGANRVIYIEVASGGTEVVVYRSYANGVSELSGRYRLEDYRRNLSDDHWSGRTQIVTDIPHDSKYADAEKARYAAIEIAAHIDVPLVKNNQFVALLAVHQATPRQWSEAEVKQVEETAEQTWAAVERARAEAALRESEAKYRMLFESIDEGYFIADVIFDSDDRPIDIFYLEANPAVKRLTGLDMAGRSLREIDPNYESHWWEAFSRVAQTGIAQRQELYAEPLKSWFSFYAFRVSDANSQRVAVVFQDITERKRTEEALQTSEARFRRIFECNMIPMGIWTIAGGIVEANDALLDLIGYPRSELEAGQINWRSLTPQEYWSLDENALREIADQGFSPAYEKVYMHKDGNPIPILFGAASFVDESDSGVFFVVDLTQSKQSEAALRERQQRLTIATEAAQLGVFEWNVQDDVAVWENDRTYEIFGHTRADGTISQQDLFERYLHPADAAAFTAKLSEVMQTGILRQATARIRRRDGVTIWIELNGRFEFAADGSPLRLMGVVADITERKRIEAERQQAEATIATDLQNTRLLRDLSARLIHEDNIQVLYDELMAAAIALTRADAGTVQILDPATQDLLLLATQGFERNMIERFYRVNASSRTPCGDALRNGDRSFVDFDVPEGEDPDGSMRLHRNAGYLSAQSTPLVSRSGKPIGMVSTHWCKQHRPSDRELQFLDLLARQAADLIEQRQAEAERKQILEREQAARAEAERANQIKDEFLAVLSHELRSPLNPILGWSKLLQQGKLDKARTTTALSTIKRNARLQSQLIEDLLDISRILRGKLSLAVMPVDLNEVVWAALETVRLAAEAKSIAIQIISSAGLGIVMGDAGRLQQVVWNLLSNAVKFTPQGEQITVTLTRTETHAQLQVADTGKGIHPNFLPYVFDHFRQEDGATTRKFGGLGLGLAIVRQIVELHGGTVTAASPGENAGATFTVQIPLAPQSSQHPTLNSDIAPSEDLSNIRIVVVDDDCDSREFVAFVLEQAGAIVTQVASGIEALQIIEQSVPDVIVSDIGMPEMDGYMLMQQVRALNVPQQVPALALTAYAGEYDRQQAILAGFQHHISKPVDPEKLVKTICGVCNSDANL